MNDIDASHARAITTNRSRTPRAVRWSETLFELAKVHKNDQLETLAIRVDGDFVQRGIELSPDGEHELLNEAAKALR